MQIIPSTTFGDEPPYYCPSCEKDVHVFMALTASVGALKPELIVTTNIHMDCAVCEYTIKELSFTNIEDE